MHKVLGLLGAALLVCSCQKQPSALKGLSTKLPVLRFSSMYDAVPVSLIKTESGSLAIEVKNDRIFFASKEQLKLPQEVIESGEVAILAPPSLFQSNESDITINGTRTDRRGEDGIDNVTFVSLPAELGSSEIELGITLSFEGDRDGPTFISLISPARIIKKDGLMGYDLRPLSSLSYEPGYPVTAIVEHDKSWIVRGSGDFEESERGTLIRSDSARQFGLVMVPQETWEERGFSVGPTAFSFLYPKARFSIDSALLETVVREVWPKWIAQMGQAAAPSVTFLEDDNNPIGGGSDASQILSLFASNSIPDAVQESIAANYGWPKRSTTKQYVELMYQGSSDPWRDYMTTIVSHELGHLFFGFGLTGELMTREQAASQAWFHLGTGILYDRQITESIIHRNVAFYDKMEDVLREKLLSNPRIDKRLDRPDLTRDASEGITSFHRLQFFSHIKSYRALERLRERAGDRAFDDIARDYVKSGDKYTDGYDSFRLLLKPLLPDLESLERELEIR